jgi:hypothetical protein
MDAISSSVVLGAIVAACCTHYLIYATKRFLNKRRERQEYLKRQRVTRLGPHGGRIEDDGFEHRYEAGGIKTWKIDGSGETK